MDDAETEELNMIYRINWRLEEDMMASYEFRVNAGNQKQAVSIFREVHPEGIISYITECGSLQLSRVFRFLPNPPQKPT